MIRRRPNAVHRTVIVDAEGCARAAQRRPGIASGIIRVL